MLTEYVIEAEEKIGQSFAKKGRPNKFKGIPRTEDTKNKISLALRGKPKSKEHIEKMRQSQTGRTLSEETKRKIRLSSLDRRHTEETKRKISEANKGRIDSVEKRLKISQSLKGKLVGSLNPFYGKHHSKEAIEKVVLAHKGISWGHHTEEFKKYMSILMTGKPRPTLSITKKKQWQDPEFAKKMISSWGRNPTKPETKLDELLNVVFPNEYKYTGNGTFSVNGCIPDFTNCNGQKKVIELFGDYWHRGQNPQDRIDKFAEFGFECLVIWEHDLNQKSEKELVDIIQNFNNKKGMVDVG